MNIKKNILLFLFFGLYSTVSFANTNPSNPIVVEAAFFETTQPINIQQVANNFNNNYIHKINTGFINVGLVTSYIWIHYKIQLPQNSTDNFIVLDNPRLNKIQAYFFANNSIIDSVITGDFYPFQSRKLAYPNFRFLLPQTANKSVDVYFLIDHRGSTLQLPIEVFSKENLIEPDQKSLLYVGLKMGVFIIPFFFGFFLFFTTKNRTYLLYSLYIFISAIWLVSTDGYGFQYLWQSYPHLNNRIEAAFGVLYSGIFAANALQFTKRYQQQKSLLRNILKWLMYFFLFWGIVPLLPFISIEYKPSTPIFLYLFFTCNIAGAFLMLFYLLSLTKKNDTAVIFYLFAVVNTIIFSVLVVGYNIGIINLSVSSSTLISIGMMIDIVFMTLGLAYQFNQYKLDKEKMLIEYIEQEKNININIIKMQEEERRRISREMHDDIGAGLTRITMMSELAKNKKDNKIELNEIALTGRKIVTSLSEIIWSMQPSNNNLEQLFIHIKEQLSELLEYTDINYSINFPENFVNQNLDSNTTRNIILMCKEVAHNAVKYSQCTSLVFSIKIIEKSLLIDIADNGIGFDINAKKSGNGLNNIGYRLKQIDATVSIISNHQGTSFIFNIPIR